ncbi:MAG: TadE family protein [Muricoprocola sp.]
MKAKGSYTVELALLMGIILPVLVSIIYIGFYCHDQGFLQGAAHEAACAASLRVDDMESNMSGVTEKLVKCRMLGTRNVAGTVSEDKKTAKISYQGSFYIPGMTRIFFGSSQIPMEANVTMTLERPSKRIQKIRSMVKVIKKVRGE